ncbi:V-ATPase V0 Subunit A, partial [Frankliniella occidentalis]
QEESDSNRALIGGDERGRLGFVAGVIPRDRVPGFERMLWRVSRGNVFLRQAPLEEPLEDPATGQPINKTVFVAFYQGENLKSRLKKVCTGYHATLYTCPSSVSEREGVVRELRIRLEDLNVVLSQTMDHRHRVAVSVAKELMTWKVMVRKMKAIYHTLNMFNMDVTNKCLIGECWVPKDELQNLRRALEDGGKAVGSTMNPIINILSTTENPPTFIRTNKFTEGFQVLVDAYAVGSYREVNPAAFTTITFPFLFSVMFGDLGHGIIVFLFAGWMCLFEKKLKKNKWGEIWDIFFGGRYIILLMGIFSMYSGLLYNDIFSLSLNIFGSGWTMNIPSANLTGNYSEAKLMLDPAEGGYRGNPYYMGIDPLWQSADNKIIFLNSFKMKLSIIIAVVHMVFGIALSIVNYVHLKKKINILLDFVPQILFLVLLFGYMVFMVVYKYFAFGPYSKKEIADDPSLKPWGTKCAPSVLISFINMVLVSANAEVKDCNQYMFPGQEPLQRAFLLIAVLMVPILLLAKPMYIKMTTRKQSTPHQALKSASNGGAAGNGIEMTGSGEQGGHAQAHAGGEHGGDTFSDVMVHQAIHTVEYVLSTVSHTASYLRLWALSLAHAQLSDVLWNMVFRRAIKIAGSMGGKGLAFTGGNFAGGFVIYVVFALWVCFTVAVLVLMEGLSAFLHTLRLHWVEFMSKFYMGSGYPFEPFTFKRILNEPTRVE